MDLDAQFRALEPQLRGAIDEILASRAFIQGPALERFNKNFLRLHGADYGTGCANGTTAITVGLRALGIGPGDEVLVPNHTFIGTAEPVVEVGANPVLVDIDEEYRQIDLNAAERKITHKTKAIIPVHLYGFPEPMDQLMEFARAHNLQVIEDCAQAHLAKWKGRAVGTFGAAGTFSFYPGKNLGAMGDAGFFVSQDAKLFDFMKRYIDHGREEKYLHGFFGANVRMDGLQAALLDVKLTKLAEWTERRRELAKAYDERLVPKGFRVMKARPEATPVYHVYVVECSNRDLVLAHMKNAGIGCNVHYPVCLNRQPAFQSLGYKRGEYPVSERMCERILSLPFFPEMTLQQMELVLNEFFQVAKP
jgi:dTDP-4-amino-4,6-dideoxygalactose transaminase